ncbi:MAG: CotH kinase family protein, partial [Clostridia bacterium]|nr:CotH kinase family protein [Clostridia bacterium]
MKRHAHIPKLLWYVLLSVLFVSLLLLSACDSNNPPSETTAESAEQTAEVPTEETSDGTDAGTGDGDSFTLPDDDEPTVEPETEDPTDPAETEEDTPSETSDESDGETSSAGGEIITLPPETVPEPETDERPMPRLDIYTDDGHDVTSKDVYKHGTATLSNCHEKFAFENVGVNIRARGNSTFGAPKKPFRLKFDAKQEMLGLNGGKAYKSWVLMADYYDGSMLRTFGTFKFAKALMESKYYSSDCTHVEVYLN